MDDLGVPLFWKHPYIASNVQFPLQCHVNLFEHLLKNVSTCLRQWAVHWFWCQTSNLLNKKIVPLVGPSLRFTVHVRSEQPPKIHNQTSAFPCRLAGSGEQQGNVRDLWLVHEFAVIYILTTTSIITIIIIIVIISSIIIINISSSTQSSASSSSHLALAHSNNLPTKTHKTP